MLLMLVRRCVVIYDLYLDVIRSESLQGVAYVMGCICTASPSTNFRSGFTCHVTFATRKRFSSFLFHNFHPLLINNFHFASRFTLIKHFHKQIKTTFQHKFFLLTRTTNKTSDQTENYHETEEMTFHRMKIHSTFTTDYEYIE